MPELVKHFTLNTGQKIPAIGFGTWKAEPGGAWYISHSAIILTITFSCWQGRWIGIWSWLQTFCKRNLWVSSNTNLILGLRPSMLVLSSSITITSNIVRWQRKGDRWGLRKDICSTRTILGYYKIMVLRPPSCHRSSGKISSGSSALLCWPLHDALACHTWPKHWRRIRQRKQAQASR